ncbi:hypothetical protein [Dietzia timorensis]|uniref:PRC-barrel domain-containing protein n=1 Tax=Dietzia timorensis TaxID=499555 RepID=A0A173LL69_9ACTN|nr:hypothetical protein [Dietzia timorensis]ANI91350.1 Hypothetical protein BJL86_0547 [Dietzia timorensis]
MSAQEQLEMLLSATAFDSAGTKVGDVRQVYLDDATGRATFASVSTGIFSADAVVPLFGSRLLDGELHLGHKKAAIKDSPRFDNSEDTLTPDQERDLLEHFGMDAPPLDPAAQQRRDAAAREDASSEPAASSAEGGDEAKAEPGTIPARRLASVEQPEKPGTHDGGASANPASPAPQSTKPVETEVPEPAASPKSTEGPAGSPAEPPTSR